MLPFTWHNVRGNNISLTEINQLAPGCSTVQEEEERLRTGRNIGLKHSAQRRSDEGTCRIVRTELCTQWCFVGSRIRKASASLFSFQTLGCLHPRQISVFPGLGLIIEFLSVNINYACSSSLLFPAEECSLPARNPVCQTVGQMHVFSHGL